MFHVSGIIHYMTLCVWLFSLSIMILKFIRVKARISTSLLFMAEQYSSVWLDHVLFICSSVDRRLGCLHLLTIVSSAFVNIHIQMFV